jgi:FkbM family methyltransferase
MRVDRAGAISLGECVARLGKVRDTGNAVDGGAGSGTTAREMIKALSPGRRVIAYEPFPGNHQFWRDLDPRIEFRKSALGSLNGEMTLRVDSAVSSDSAWGARGMAGYSSLGFLTESEPKGPLDCRVNVVCGDDDLVQDLPIGVTKLDLQGGKWQPLRVCVSFWGSPWIWLG